MFYYKNGLLYIWARSKLASNEIEMFPNILKYFKKKSVPLSVMNLDELTSIFPLEIFRSFQTVSLTGK